MSFAVLNQALTWDELGLTATRLSAVVACLWALATCGRMLRYRASSQVTIIPKAIIYFAMAWTAILLGISVYLLVTDAEAVSKGWFRALYGSAFVWTIFGMTWIVAYGSRGAITAMQVLDLLDKHAASKKAGREE